MIIIARIAVALVWVYEGLVAKIIGARPDELAIIGSVPFLPDGAARVVMIMIGSAEVIIAIWVLTARAPRAAAVGQTLVLTGFNTGGLIFGGGEIAEPAHLLVTNFALLALVWLVALTPSRRG